MKVVLSLRDLVEGEFSPHFCIKCTQYRLIMKLCRLNVGLLSCTQFLHSFADDMLLVAHFRRCLEVMIELTCRQYDFNFERIAVVFTLKNMQETESI